jgi:hypothetical protein
MALVNMNVKPAAIIHVWCMSHNSSCASTRTREGRVLVSTLDVGAAMRGANGF